jgi:hypothetical protein
MERKERNSSIAGGLLLVLLGLAFLTWQLAPQWVSQYVGEFTWPWLIIGLGVAFLLAGLVTRTGGFLIPGSIISGIGGLLYYQNTTGDWVSWSYAWTLIPGFVGLGLLLSGLIDPVERSTIRPGLIMFGISVSVFMIFWSLFHANLSFGLVWPVVLILVGLGILAQSFFKRRV